MTSCSAYRPSTQLAASDRPQITGYLELGGGYDSNVNSATGAGTVAVPGFGGGLFVLDPLSVKKADSYGQLSGGLSGRYPLGPGLAAVGGLRGYLRRNDTEDRFDTDETAGDIGLNVTRGRTSYLVAVQGSEFYLDNDRYRRAYGGTGQWLYNQLDLQLELSYLFAPKWSLLPQLSYTSNDSNIEISDYNRTLIYLGVRRSFE